MAGVTGPLFVTAHAVQRYREIVRPSATHAEAVVEILDGIATRQHRARPQKTDSLEIEVRGFETRCGQGAFRAIVGQPKKKGGLPAVTTILPRQNRTAQKRRSEERKAKMAMGSVCAPC